MDQRQYDALNVKLDVALKSLGILLKHSEKEMSAIDDLNNAVTALAAGFNTLDTAVQTEIAALEAALGSAGINDPAISAAAANISTVVNKMAQDAAALTASIPAATTTPPPASGPATTGTPTATPPTITPPPVTDPTATPPVIDPTAMPPDAATSSGTQPASGG